MPTRARIACLAALLAAALAAPAIAKPPDLPAKQTVSCDDAEPACHDAAPSQDTTAEEPQQSFIVGLWFDDNLLSYTHHVEKNGTAAGPGKDVYAFNAIDLVCPCWVVAARALCAVVSDEPAGPTAGPAECPTACPSACPHGTTGAKPCETGAPAKPADVTCPYLKAKAAEAAAPPPAPAAEPPTVLENLTTLEKAAKLYRRAERCRRHERVDEAKAAYAKVQELCPGSRYAHLASERLEELQARQPAEDTPAVGEEQEAPPAQQPPAENGPCPVCPACPPSHPGCGSCPACPKDAPQSDVISSGDSSVLLQEAEDLLRRSSYTEIDLSGPAGPRVLCELEAAGIAFRLTAGDDGTWKCSVTGLANGAGD